MALYIYTKVYFFLGFMKDRKTRIRCTKFVAILESNWIGKFCYKSLKMWIKFEANRDFFENLD